VTPVEARADSAIIVNGARIPCAAPVVLWGESKLSFQARPKRKETRVVVCHWTGGEGGASQLFSVLASRKVSVQFFVDAHGLIWQFCDADRECVHCPGWNASGIGIEIQNRGSELGKVNLPRGIERSEVREQIHGRLVTYSDYTPQQYVSVVTLVRALCDAYHLPVQVPLDRAGKVITGALSKPEMARFKGVGGHYHAGVKDDPGPKLLRLIHDQEQDDGPRA
jgi:N-acetylmuramoyl-L-alanine amidase